MGDCRRERRIRIPSEAGVPVTTELYGERIGAALRERYGERRHAAKVVARLAGGTARAAQNWIAGICGPQASALIVLMAREPAVAEAVAELVERQRLLDAARARRTPP